MVLPKFEFEIYNFDIFDNALLSTDRRRGPFYVATVSEKAMSISRWFKTQFDVQVFESRST